MIIIFSALIIYLIKSLSRTGIIFLLVFFIYSPKQKYINKIYITLNKKVTHITIPLYQLITTKNLPSEKGLY